MSSIASPRIRRQTRPSPCRDPEIEPASESAGERTVLCLHCSTGSSRQWQSLAALLREEHRVLTPDLLGYGDNPPWPAQGRLSLELEVRRLLGRIPHAARGLDVVAHSFGAAVAVKLARMHPQRVRSLILYEPALFGLLREDRQATAALARILATAGHVGSALSRRDDEAAAARFIDFWSEQGSWKAMPEARRRSIRAVIHKVRADFHALLADKMSLADIARMDIPVLCMSGERSPAATRRIADLLTRTFPRARRVRIEDAGHMGPLTHAAAVNARIEEFLRFLSGESRDLSSHTLFAARAA